MQGLASRCWRWEPFRRPGARYWPLRWYQQILFDQAARGSPVHASSVPFAILAGMALGLFTLVWLCLRRSLPPREEDAASSQGQERSGLGHAFKIGRAHV